MPLHAKALVAASLAWCGFWLCGLPAYYQQYSTAQLIFFMVAITPPTAFISVKLVPFLYPHSYVKSMVLIAFYGSVPFAIYDSFYCGAYLGWGFGFFRQYWYLTVYYVVPWLVLPPLGFVLDQRRRG